MLAMGCHFIKAILLFLLFSAGRTSSQTTTETFQDDLFPGGLFSENQQSTDNPVAKSEDKNEQRKVKILRYQPIESPTTPSPSRRRGPDGGNDAPTVTDFPSHDDAISFRPTGFNPFAETDPEFPFTTRSAEEVSRVFPWIDDAQPISNLSDLMDNSRGLIVSPDSFRRWLNLDDQYEFRPRVAAMGPNGRYRVRFEQRWSGVPVYNSRLVVEQEKTGLLLGYTADGELIEGIENDLSGVQARIPRLRALSIARKYHKHRGVHIDNRNVDLRIVLHQGKATLAYIVDYFVTGISAREWRQMGRRARNKARNSNYVGHQELKALITGYPAVFLGSDTFVLGSDTFLVGSDIFGGLNFQDEENPRLITLNDNTKYKRPYTMIHAHTGEVLKSWEGLTSAYAAVDLAHGNPSSVNEISRQYVMKSRETCYYTYPLGRNKHVTVSWRQASRRASPFVCDEAKSFDYDNLNGALSPRNAAYVWTLKVLGYLKTISNTAIQRNIDIVINRDASAVAFWTGSQLLLGAGNDHFYPMTEPDIVAHEVGHIFTNEMSDLVYNGQSGAISESFSDMAAVAFMNSVQMKNSADEDDYTLGSRVSKKGHPLRDICEPNSKLVLTYMEDHPYVEHTGSWKTSTSVHRGNGIYNKAFCLLSKRPGWDIEKAFKVFVDANVYYWQPESTFNSAACGVVNAAIDLMGIRGKRDVDEAFSSVGVLCSDLANI